MKKLLFLIFISISGILSATEYTVETIPNPKTINNSYVSNPDGILREETVYQINTILDTLEAKNGAQVAVVVVNSIGSESIEIFANSLFKKWGIGSKKNNNGLLIVFVQDQRLVDLKQDTGLKAFCLMLFVDVSRKNT